MYVCYVHWLLYIYIYKYPQPATVGEPTDVVETLQTKGRQLLSRLSTVAWNERGELMHDGVAIPGSNAVDLVHDLLRKRKTSDLP